MEGEIEEDDVETAAIVPEPAAAPGTVVEGVGVVNAEGLVVANDLIATPTRKKPLPPRRKKKGGPGRGKKGPIALREAMERGEIIPATPTSAALLGIPANASDEATSAAASTQGDTPMPDAQDGDEGSSEEGEEGDEDAGSEEGELPQSPSERATAGGAPVDTTQPAVIKAEDTATDISYPPPHLIPPAISINRDISSSPDQPLALGLTNRNGSFTQPPEGSIPAESADLPPDDVHFEDGEGDVFGSLERHLENETKPAPDV